jgi:hypothetical protein
VNVKFPRGIITETFPAPVTTYPAKSSDPVLANGEATFDVRILREEQNKFPFVDNKNIYSHARNVASNAIASGREYEKFVFYRGLGQFQPQIRITSKQGALKIEGNAQTMPQAAFLVDVDQSGDTRMLNLGDLRSREVAEISASLVNALGNHRSNSPLMLNGAQGKAAMISSLVAAGLKNDEATAMLNTWENGYLKVTGVRLLYVLPRAEVDATLPLTMTPAPQSLARVFVGRLEILTDIEEGRILTAVLQDRENFNVNALGRFSEAILRRIAEVYNSSSNVKPNPETSQMISRLVQRAASSEGAYNTATH